MMLDDCKTRVDVATVYTLGTDDDETGSSFRATIIGFIANH